MSMHSISQIANGWRSIAVRTTRAGSRSKYRLLPTDKKSVIKKSHSCVWAYSPEHCLGSALPRSKKANQDPAGIRIELALGD